MIRHVIQRRISNCRFFEADRSCMVLDRGVCWRYRGIRGKKCFQPIFVYKLLMFWCYLYVKIRKYSQPHSLDTRETLRVSCSPNVDWVVVTIVGSCLIQVGIHKLFRCQVLLHTLIENLSASTSSLSMRCRCLQATVMLSQR